MSLSAIIFCKPKKTALADFFEKIESYVDQIAGPAMAETAAMPRP